MGKIQVEICLISARGLRVGVGIGSSLLKHQWYAVGWLNPEDKYCTTIDASRSDNPVWRTKFATLLDDSAIQDSKSALHVEVYCREPIFLRKRLHGSATVSLKEFLTKYKQQQSSSKSVIEETGSYQLRKTNSSKPQGFVDVSIRISAEREDFGGFTGDIGGVMLSNNSDYNTSGQDYMAGSSQQHPFASFNNSNPFSVPPYNHHSSMPPNPPMNNTNPQMKQPYYPPPMQPPPPPPHLRMQAIFLHTSPNQRTLQIFHHHHLEEREGDMQGLDQGLLQVWELVQQLELVQLYMEASLCQDSTYLQVYLTRMSPFPLILHFDAAIGRFNMAAL
ncbi:hypothetical protein V5N11_035035 [Cardamine amara subsp. amara]|uniref:C2 domain-containing protein n=1 Tax=Cardamine amara subsp. amara TaxID=228776 RepID=A0ABD1BSC6_CARAN